MRTYKSLDQLFEFHYYAKLLYRIYIYIYICKIIVENINRNYNFITPQPVVSITYSHPGTKLNDQIIPGMVEI